MAKRPVARETDPEKRAAQKVRSRRWYLRNQELAKARAAARHEANRDSILLGWRESYKADPEPRRAANKQSRIKNQERQKPAKRISDARWKKNNPEKVREANRRRAKSPAGRESHKNWRIRNRERLLAAARARWPFRDKTKLRETRRDWRQRNRDKIRSHDQNRRARLADAPGFFKEADIQRMYKAQRGKCAYCRTSLKGGYHVDHIIPVSRGGTNWPRNLQLLCGPCNQKKHATDPVIYARRIGLLI